ncbi:MAG: hypothetical protein K2J11_01460 [Oscillospiraceae bacterium]|nr:hypothetical protein [Oscillospiraceae bacterium]
MKKVIFTAIVLIITVLAMPAVGAFAAEKPLEDIPIWGYSESGKAYCRYDETDGEYVLTYFNSNGSERLYKSKKKFAHDESFSEDGETVFYQIDNTVYRYSYESGKRKKIYTLPENKSGSKRFVRLYSSPNGEYCAIRIEYIVEMEDDDIELILWHDGKTVSQSEKATFGFEDSDNFYGVNDFGEVFYTLDRDIYILDFDGKRLAEKVPDGKDKKKKIYPNSRTYLLYCGNDFYFGEIGGERHKLSFSENSVLYIKAENGESLIAYNEEYIARYDIKSGKSSNILKMSPEKYWDKRQNSMAVSSDLNEAAYINHSKRKIVRLSDWSDKKNRYTKKQEIGFLGDAGTGNERIRYFSDDLSLIELWYTDSTGNVYIADFDSGRLAPSDYFINGIDRFGHIIINKNGVETADPEGNKTKVFDALGTRCEPYMKNGFYIFYGGGPEEYYCDEGDYEVTYYYIDESGKAVKWFDTMLFFGEIWED